MTSKHNPARRKALQLAAGVVAMAASPVPVMARLQVEGGFAGPSTNVLWKPIDDARRFEKPYGDLLEVGFSR
ncbi:hypothetical protein FHT32_003700 [Variovorax sp. SG517]|uniref:hypothetical protein n=1 Tax=Variovorax sp. SG517 TaxID=2587117 RepID=UPI00159E80FF|nr:hypothetical protein [Variovorax sp. SG517]NVM90043.1 hypothetical protein [Variovorax sp. SG517]